MVGVMVFADLSHHNPSIDFATYRTVRNRIALKCTEATGFVDPLFNTRWKIAGSLAMPRIAYHFQRVDTDPVAQWRNCINTINKAGGMTSRDRICLDIEDDKGATPAHVKPGAARNAQIFVQQAVEAGFSEGLIYSGNWYLKPNQITASLFPAGWRQLWISEYSARNDLAIAVPVGWSRNQIVARQYTDTGTVLGVSGPCDDSRVLNDWLTTTPTTPTREGNGLMADITLQDIGGEMTDRLMAFKGQHLDGTLNRVKDIDEVQLPAIETRLAALEAAAGITPDA